MTDTPTVHHDAEQHKFYIQEEGGEARLSYRQADDSTLDFHSTFTPPALRGRGLAAAVVTAGLDYAREHELRVIPTCPYVASFLDAHPDYADLRAGS